MWRLQNAIAATEGKGKGKVNMNAPIASVMAEAFCRGFKEQAKKGEKEAEEIVNTIIYNVLKALCTRYDNEIGGFPEYAYVEASVFKFFDKLKADVEKRKNKDEEKR